MKSRWTPGPWLLSVGPNPWNLAIVPKEGHPAIIATPTHHVLQAFSDGQEIMTANAKVMAAAPELAECLRRMESAISSDPDHEEGLPFHYRGVVDEARALLQRIEE